LAGIFAEHVGERTIDFLSIDVEGHEEAVLRGADWTRWRPRVVVVESTKPHSRELTDLRWEPILLEARYHFAIFDGLNRFYVRDEDRDWLALLRSPVCIFDSYVSMAQILHRRYQFLQGQPTQEVLNLLAPVSWMENKLVPPEPPPPPPPPPLPIRILNRIGRMLGIGKAA
jgi:hypothetical protein